MHAEKTVSLCIRARNLYPFKQYVYQRNIRACRGNSLVCYVLVSVESGGYLPPLR